MNESAPDSPMGIRIKRGEELFGPYSLDEARTYRGAGRIGPDDLASSDGSTWRPVDELLGTPSLVARYEPGGLSPRFFAGLIDLLLVGVFLLPPLLVFAVDWTRNPTDWEELLAVVGIVGAIVYPFAKDGLPGGRSIGKRLTGLMVVHLPSNRPCPVWRSAIRSLVLLLTNLLPVVGGLLEPVLVLATKDHRRLGDRAAGTMVIPAADYRP